MTVAAFLHFNVNNATHSQIWVALKSSYFQKNLLLESENHWNLSLILSPIITLRPTIETCFLIRSKTGFFLILEKILANDLYSATFKVLFTEIYHVNPHISNNSHYIKYAYP